MKLIRLLAVILLLLSCDNKTTTEVNLSAYFNHINGTAVFYNPATSEYKIHNPSLSHEKSSPCSTFKIMSAYIALSEHLVTMENSQISWSGINYEFSAWNKDMNIKEAFKTSCVWYFRALLDKLSSEKVATYLQKYHYGNQDISDWHGNQNTNTMIKELKGFWIESSLKISPVEQVQFLARIFAQENQTTQTLKELMLVADTPVKIYGKTGLGIKDDLVHNAWFVGFYELNQQPIFFAVRLNDEKNNIHDYRHQASYYAKKIALEIIQKANLF